VAYQGTLRGLGVQEVRRSGAGAGALKHCISGARRRGPPLSTNAPRPIPSPTPPLQELVRLPVAPLSEETRPGPFPTPHP
jgi:hypothetical protein